MPYFNKKKNTTEQALKNYYIDGKSLDYLKSFLRDKKVEEKIIVKRIFELHQVEKHKREKQAKKDKNIGFAILSIYLFMFLYKLLVDKLFDPFLGRGFILLIASIPFIRSWWIVKKEGPKFKMLSKDLQ